MVWDEASSWYVVWDEASSSGTWFGMKPVLGTWFSSNQYQEENAALLHWEMKAQVLQPAGPKQLESLSPAPRLPQKGV